VKDSVRQARVAEAGAVTSASFEYFLSLQNDRNQNKNAQLLICS